MAAEGPISSFPMDKEAAEEEIALLVRKPGFDELTPADIARHMNNRFNINFDAYKSELKRMVFEQLKKRDEDNSSESSDEDHGGNDSDEEEEKKKPEKLDVKKEIIEKPTKEEDSDSDDGIDMSERYKPNKKKGSSVVLGDMVSNVKSSRRAAASNAIKQIRNTSEGGRFNSSKKKKVKDPNEDHSGKFGPMTKLCYISTELQQITGDQFMKRCDVVKKLWDYIKEKNLKDPKSGQFFLCDEVLETIFKKKRVKAFGMTKFLTRHIIGPNDMAPEIRAESEREMEERRAAWLERKRKREAESEVCDDVGPSEKKVKEEREEDADSD